MARDDKDQRTEPATGRRRQQAFDEGNFARSQDMKAALSLLVGMFVLYLMGQTILGTLSNAMRGLLGTLYTGTEERFLQDATRDVLRPMLRVVPTFLLVMAVTGIVAGIMQVGLRFNGKPLTPNLSRLNPLQGLSRLWAGQNWFQLAMNVTKLIAVAVLGYVWIDRHLPQIVALPALDFPANMITGFEIVFGLAIRIAVVLLILGILDWIYHKWKFEVDIRMTKQEVKDEMKMMEGDMEMKGRRRQLARKMLMQRIRTDVPRSDVVVTNPTELAIAIRYDPETMRAPRVVAKGADYLAMTIRQVAIAHGVPIVERKPLAQALYKGVEVGQEVPPEFYQAVAEILAYVYELAGKKPAMRQRVSA